MDNTPKTLQEEVFVERSLYKLIYCSLASQSINSAEIENIIATANHHNARFGITGFLMHGSGIFFQWLEGPKENVISLMKLIVLDKRHFNVVILSEEEDAGDRLFPDWNMALVEAAEIEHLMKKALREASDDKKKQMLSMFLKQIE